jgi:hypothetical protein
MPCECSKKYHAFKPTDEEHEGCEVYEVHCKNCGATWKEI